MRIANGRWAARHGDVDPWTRRALLALLVVAALVLISFLLVSRLLWVRYDSAQDQLEPRIERLDGILRSGGNIESRLASARSAVQPWLHEGGDAAPNLIGQKLRELVVETGSTLVSTQAVKVPNEEAGLPRIRLSATVSGEWSQLVRFMTRLQSQQPPFWIRSANMMREGSTAPNAPQRARLVLQLDAPISPEKGLPL